MKLTLHASLGILLAAGFPITSLGSHAEAHCPANVSSLHPRIVAGALLVIPVNINQSGTYDFMVDTGSQLNVIDPALAAQLHLKSKGTVGLVATAAYSRASVGELDSLQVGSQLVSKPLVAVHDLGPIQAADSRIRGVLGENFLSHFDVLIDYSHRLLCLDEAKLMDKALRGERIPLVSSKHPGTDLAFTERLVVSVNLSDTGTRPILLQVDSGSDGAILYAGNRWLEQLLLKGATLQGPEVSDARRAFAVLPPQDMRLGSQIVRKVAFVTPASKGQNPPDREEDGILATVLFQRVYISHSDQFIIFDPSVSRGRDRPGAPRASRSFMTAEFRLWSKSTKVSDGQRCWRNCSRVTIWPPCSSSRSRIRAGCSRSLTTVPLRRSSPLSASSSKTPKRQIRGVLTGMPMSTLLWAGRNSTPFPI
jgi:hypothetical protein